MAIHIINGPNLNLLGKREPQLYGSRGFEEYLVELRQQFAGVVELEYFQSNHEGALIDYIHTVGFDTQGLVINAGAYTHTSLALADAVKAVACRAVEVHISNIFAREAFRHHSYLSAVSVGIISGLGLQGYALAVQYLLNN